MAPPDQATLQAFFAELSEYGLSPNEIEARLKKIYTTPVGKSGTQLGKLLSERSRLGDTTALRLKEMGYQDANGELLPPKDISQVYHKMYELLFASAAKAGIPEEKIIYPVFLFKNTQGEIRKIRPGIDPLPQKGEWRLVKSMDELPEQEFESMILARQMPFDPIMLPHDIGHMIDFIERPRYMQAYPELLEAKHKALPELGKIRKEIYAGKRPPSDLPAQLERMEQSSTNMVRLANELVYLPSPERAEEIRRLLPGLSLSSRSPQEIRQRYLALAPDELLKRADSLLDHKETLFSRHGGGARDWTYERWRSDLQLTHGFREIAKEESIGMDFLNTLFKNELDYQNFFLLAEPPALLDRIRILRRYIQKETLAQNEKSALETWIEQYLRKEERVSMEAVQKGADRVAREFLAQHLAEVELRISSALNTKLTPEQIMRDMALLYQPNGSALYKQSPTYKYFSSYRTGSAQRTYFVDIAGP